MAKQLSYKPLIDIGINGLNTQTNPASLGPDFLVQAENIVIKESGRVSIRKGLKQMTIPTGTSIDSMVEHNDQGTTKIFASYGTSIYTVNFATPNAAFPSSGADVKHTVAGTKGDWQFINFNNRLHCLHSGVVPQRYDGSAPSNEKWSTTYATNAINIANGSETPAVGNIVKNKTYQITVLGTIPTPFDLVGGNTDNAVGEVFTATETSAAAISESIAANKMIATTRYKIINLGDTDFTLNGHSGVVLAVGSFVVGTSYTIKTVASTNFVAIGASANTVGIVFTATGVGSGGSGTATSRPIVDDVFEANDVLGIGTGLVAEVFDGTNGKVVEVKTNPTLTTITVDSTNGFTSSGQLILSDEVVTYTGKTSTTFTGCIRGSKGTTATHHLDNAVVTNNTAPPTVSSGEFKPTCGTGFYGRLWLGGVEEEKDVLHYSALLDGDDFTLRSGGGAFDLKNVWGKDDIIAIAPFYGQLAVFGKNNIALYSRPDSVSQMQLSEVIRGIGCIARDTVQAIGDDLVFLSSTGLRSLARTSEKDKVPLTDLSVNIKDTLIRNLAQTLNITSGYIENEGVYVLSFPTINLTYVFDFKHLTPNAAPRITTWTFTKNRNPSSIIYTTDFGMLVGQKNGGIAEYFGYYDTTRTLDSNNALKIISDSYTSSFATVWLDLGETVQASLLKKLFMVLEGGSGSTLFLRWYKDFSLSSSKITSLILNPRTIGFNALWGKSPGTGKIKVVQPASTLYGAHTVTTLTVGSLVVGSYYAIASLGTTTQAQWNTLAGTTNSPITYIVGSVLKVSVNSQSIGNGTVVSHTHLAANHIRNATFAPVYGLKEYRTPLVGSAKYLKISIEIISNGYSTSLQNMTLLHKQGKIR